MKQQFPAGFVRKYMKKDIEHLLPLHDIHRELGYLWPWNKDVAIVSFIPFFFNGHLCGVRVIVLQPTWRETSSDR